MARTIARLAAVSCLAWMLALPTAALALDLDTARARGLVGEQTDGYVGAVRGEGDAEVHRLVAEVNAKRRAHYEQIARQQGAAVEVVASLAGAKLIERMPPGTWIGDNGRWYQKK